MNPVRTLLTLVIGCAALVFTPADALAACANSDVAPTTSAQLEIVRPAVLCLHNQDRAARGLPLLREHDRLRQAAAGHSLNMVADGFFAHTAPGGVTMTDRIRRSGYLRGPRGWSIGENIGWATGGLATAQEIHDAWMRSPGHRANVLARKFREIGIGIELGAPLSANAGATYTADFGVRR